MCLSRSGPNEFRRCASSDCSLARLCETSFGGVPHKTVVWVVWVQTSSAVCLIRHADWWGRVRVRRTQWGRAWRCVVDDGRARGRAARGVRGWCGAVRRDDESVVVAAGVAARAAVAAVSDDRVRLPLCAFGAAVFGVGQAVGVVVAWRWGCIGPGAPAGSPPRCRIRLRIGPAMAGLSSRSITSARY